MGKNWTKEEILSNDKALLIKVDGSVEEVEPKNGTDFKLQELYDMLGVELVDVVCMPNNNDKIMIVDDEGMYRSERNERGSVFLDECYGVPCDIYGDVLVVGNKQFK